MIRVSALLPSIVAGILMVSPAHAQDKPGVQPEQSAPTNGEGDAADEKKICRRVPVTGTRMAKTTCRTQAEWNAQAAADSANAGRARDTSGNVR